MQKTVAAVGLGACLHVVVVSVREIVEAGAAIQIQR